MSVFDQHPDDTEENNLQLATNAVIRAHQTNRFYAFPYRGGFDIAFANARRNTNRNDDIAFALEYHTAVSMDVATVRDFVKTLEMLLKEMDERAAALDDQDKPDGA